MSYPLDLKALHGRNCGPWSAVSPCSPGQAGQPLFSIGRFMAGPPKRV